MAYYVELLIVVKGRIVEEMILLWNKLTLYLGRLSKIGDLEIK